MKQFIKWASVSVLAVFFAIGIFGAIFSDSAPETEAAAAESEPTATPSYVGGKLGCGHFHNVIIDFSNGFLTDFEFREKIKEVKDDTSFAEPGIRIAGADLLRSATADNADTFLVAVTDMYDACKLHGYLVSTS